MSISPNTQQHCLNSTTKFALLYFYNIHHIQSDKVTLSFNSMGLNLKRPNYRPLVFLCTLAAILICAEYSLHLMQKFKRFVLVLHEVLAEFRPSISHNITDVRLLLWTRKSPLKYNYLYIGDTVSLSTCGFDRSKETKILIHGFSDQGLTGWVKNFKKFYLDRGDYNIISVSCTHIFTHFLRSLETCI